MLVGAGSLSLVLLGLASCFEQQRLNRTDPGFDAVMLALRLASARAIRRAGEGQFLERVLARISEILEMQAAGSAQRPSSRGTMTRAGSWDNWPIGGVGARISVM